jgi:stage II sporulation protein D
VIRAIKSFFILFTFPSKHQINFYYKIFLFFLLLLLVLSCSATKRFPSDTERQTPGKDNTEVVTDPVANINLSKVRILLDETESTTHLTFQSPVYLTVKNNKVALIKPGNTIECINNGDGIKVAINDQRFEGENFFLEAVEDNITFNGNSYRGIIQLSASRNFIGVVNHTTLEDYVKGVLSKEMPLGKGEENLEALKALALCVRTYAVIKIREGKSLYDLFDDTRDQVYGGLKAENPLSNKAADETQNMILRFDGTPAVLYYHSTCGGSTEAANNVFVKNEIPYMMGIEDGDEPYCKISPRFEWTEKYSEDKIIQRLKKASLLDVGEYVLDEINISSRFNSGRVNEIQFLVKDFSGKEKTISVFGNQIRYVLRTSDNKGILWSNFFDINFDGNVLEIYGKGFGHGVGLCQYGAIALSKNGRSYSEILKHYYPGIEIGLLND